MNCQKFSPEIFREEYKNCVWKELIFSHWEERICNVSFLLQIVKVLAPASVREIIVLDLRDPSTVVKEEAISPLKDGWMDG